MYLVLTFPFYVVYIGSDSESYKTPSDAWSTVFLPKTQTIVAVAFNSSRINSALAVKHDIAYGIIVAKDSILTLSVRNPSGKKSSGMCATTTSVTSPTPRSAELNGT